MPKNTDDLHYFIIQEWNDILKSILIGLIESMKCWCKLIIENNGK